MMSFLQTVVPMVLRRPVLLSELQAISDEAIRVAESHNNFYAAVEVALGMLIQHPEFLYRIEIGDIDSSGLFKLEST